MMFAKDEPIALKIVGGVFEVERLACCRVLGRSHLVLSPAQPFGRARLSHEGEGLRDDEREILAEQSVHLTGTGERGIFPDAENAQPAARIMGADLDRLASEDRSEEHTSELQSLMRISYAVFCLKKKK